MLRCVKSNRVTVRLNNPLVRYLGSELRIGVPTAGSRHGCDGRFVVAGLLLTPASLSEKHPMAATNFTAARFGGFSGERCDRAIDSPEIRPAGIQLAAMQ